MSLFDRNIEDEGEQSAGDPYRLSQLSGPFLCPNRSQKRLTQLP